MYAVIKVGGKQQRVTQGDVIEAEYYKGEEPGAEVRFRPILLVDDDGKTHFGKDLEKASVVAKVLGSKKGDKVEVVKYRPKTRYKRNTGHRQMLSLLEISEVALAGKAPRAKAAADDDAADTGSAAPAGKAAPKPAAKAAAKAAPKRAATPASKDEPEAADEGDAARE